MGSSGIEAFCEKKPIGDGGSAGKFSRPEGFCVALPAQKEVPRTARNHGVKEGWEVVASCMYHS